jgi:hypothetical protein
MYSIEDIFKLLNSMIRGSRFMSFKFGNNVPLKKLRNLNLRR